MAKVKLNEVVSSDMKYTEVKNEEKRPGVLRTIKGNITDYLANRNGRVYGKKLWEKALTSDYVKEQMANNCFFGEANHPFDDRMEIDIDRISHAVRDINIGPDSVTAKIDILDTPEGNIINKLVEYGSKIGISSRGCGSLNEQTNEVEDDYQVFAFDLVVRPSVASARLTESEQLVKDGKVTMTEAEIKNVLNGYKSILKEKENVSDINISTSKIVNQLMKESEDLNRKKE